MKCSGLHCPGCGDGGGAAAIAVLAVVVIAAAAARPVVHAAETALKIALIVAGSLAALAVAGGAAYAAVQVARWRAETRQAISRQAVERQALTEPRRAAIEAPKPVLCEIEVPGFFEIIDSHPQLQEGSVEYGRADAG